MRLQTLKSEGEGLTRTFAFPPNAPAKDRLNVRMHYLAPSLFTEHQEKVKVKHVGTRRRNAPELNVKDFKETLSREVLLKSIEKIEGATLGKLSLLIPLNPQQVAKAGGMETKVPMDPTISGQKAEAEDNIVDLLTGSNEFFEWVLEVCTDLSSFQDDEWAEQVENLRNGRGTSTGDASAPSAGTAGNVPTPTSS